MHIVFVDTVVWPYRIDAPLHRPIGGTQSALCYLMMALAARGLRVSFINAEPPHEIAGVRGLSADVSSDTIADADMIVVISAAIREYPDTLRRMAPKAKIILWQHHAPDQPSVKSMGDAETLAAWDAIVFVSQWQEREYLTAFPAVAAAKRVVLRNAIAPVFDHLFTDLPILACKSMAPRLSYASTPFRGLDRLLYAWPQVLNDHPGAELQIFSSMQLYSEEDGPQMAMLLDNARAMPGVVHVGAVPKDVLAEGLRSSLILAFPSTFPETACIAVMEAMAAGCFVVTTDLGALPETMGNYGVCLPHMEDPARHAESFTKDLSRILGEVKTQWYEGTLQEKLESQVRWAVENYSWTSRAAEWESFARRITQ